MLNKRTKHLCSTCLHAVWSGSPTCKTEDVEWNVSCFVFAKKHFLESARFVLFIFFMRNFAKSFVFIHIFPLVYALLYQHTKYVSLVFYDKPLSHTFYWFRMLVIFYNQLSNQSIPSINPTVPVRYPYRQMHPKQKMVNWKNKYRELSIAHNVIFC